MRQIMDVKTIGEALRLMLIERHVFTDAEYQTKYSEVEERLKKSNRLTCWRSHA